MATTTKSAPESFLDILHRPGDVFEIRVLGVLGNKKRTDSGFFDDHGKAAGCAIKIDNTQAPRGIYVTVNPLKRAILARTANRIKERAESTASDQHVDRRLWLPIDVDPTREGGVTDIAATDAEIRAAADVAETTRSSLSTMAWPEPLEANSGNGRYLFYPIDLPNDDATTDLLRRVLIAINQKNGTAEAQIDLTMFNASRIIRLMGTTNRKGDSLPDRPHRLSTLDYVPEYLNDGWANPIPLERLEAVAVLAKESSTSKPTSGKNGLSHSGSFNHKLLVAPWLDAHGWKFGDEQRCADGRSKWKILCPFNPDHGMDAAILQSPDGKLAFHCLHNSCAGNGWQEAKLAIGPPAGDHYDPPRNDRNGHTNEFTAKMRQINSKSTPPTPPPQPWQPFPTDALPGAIARYIREASVALGCDESFVALTLLAALASAIGNTRRVRVKREWREPCILWTVIVGDSGTMKSPAWNLATKPLLRRQSEEFRICSEAEATYAQELERHKAAIQKWRNVGVKSGEPPPEEPAEPVARRFIVENTTVEALAPILDANPRGVLLSQDELAGWFGSFDRYANGKKGADLASWLSMHRAGPITIDRKTGKRLIHIPEAVVSITGSIQPETLAAALGREHFADGLASRLLLAMPPRRAKHWTEAEISDEATLALEDLFSRLLKLDFAGSAEGEPEPYILPMTPDAKSAWVVFFEEHAEETAALTGDLAAAWSKIECYAARLALLAALCRTPEATTVDIHAMQTGIVLARWFAYEADRVYQILAESPDQAERRRLVELIERKGRSITVRDLVAGDRRFRGGAELAEAALNGLVEAELGRWDDSPSGPRGGRPGHVFRLCQRVSSQHNPQNPAENDSSADADSAATRNCDGESPDVDVADGGAP